MCCPTLAVLQSGPSMLRRGLGAGNTSFLLDILWAPDVARDAVGDGVPAMHARVQRRQQQQKQEQWGGRAATCCTAAMHSLSAVFNVRRSVGTAI